MKVDIGHFSGSIDDSSFGRRMAGLFVEGNFMSKVFRVVLLHNRVVDVQVDGKGVDNAPAGSSAPSLQTMLVTRI